MLKSSNKSEFYDSLYIYVCVCNILSVWNDFFFVVIYLWISDILEIPEEKFEKQNSQVTQNDIWKKTLMSQLESLFLWTRRTSEIDKQCRKKPFYILLNDLPKEITTNVFCFASLTGIF